MILTRFLRAFLALQLLFGSVAADAQSIVNRPRAQQAAAPGIRLWSVAALTALMPAETGNTILGTDTAPITTGQALQDTRHTIRGAGTGMVLTLTGVEWNTMRGELALPSYTVQAQIIPDATGTPINVTCGGSTTCTVGGGVSYLDTDPIGRTWANGDGFTLRVLATGSRLPAVSPAGTTNSQLYTDEAAQTAASGLSLASAPVDSLNRRRRLCVVAGIFMQRPATDVTVAAVADSIGAYQTSNLAANSSTADHTRGDFVRAVGQYYATINLGIGGDQVSSALYTNRTVQRMLARRATVIYDGLGVNEIENRAIDGAQAWAFHLRFAATWPGKAYFHSTLVPRTASTDGWATEANQTPDATKTARINAYNVLTRATTNYIDRRLYFQGTNTDVFGAGYALDGLHPTLAGIANALTNAATYKTAVDAATAVSTTQPSAAFTLTGTPTFSGNVFVRGTGTADGIAASGVSSSLEFRGNATAISAFDILCGTAGRLFINSSGIPTYTRQSSGTQYQAAAPASIVGSGEHAFRVVTTITGTNVFMDDMVTPLITVAVVPNAVTTNTRCVATVTNGAGSLRDIASYASDRTGATFPAAGVQPANDNTLVAWWPMAANGSAVLGPWLGAQ